MAGARGHFFVLVQELFQTTLAGCRVEIDNHDVIWPLYYLYVAWWDFLFVEVIHDHANAGVDDIFPHNLLQEY